MSDLGKAYVQIIPKAEGISGKISNLLKPGTKKAGTEGGLNIASGIKKALIGAGIAAPIIGIFKSAMDEGGKLQQSYGGLETIYGEAAAAAKKYASEAAAAGISANDYAEQAVSFGASLRQAFGGDTAKAVESANTAILDMTDNAAKMGTPLENIQNTYQGFAKQNYTMLDNLKLGYGGTKTEMQRLLADAEKISGVKYDISNLGDVYEAIHVIQGELGLTGVAAAEASETFTGSLGAMKAAASNLMGNLALGEDIEPAMKVLVGNAVTFLSKNMLPMIGTIAKSIPTAIKTAVEVGVPILKETGKELIDTIVTGAKTEIPTLLTEGQTLVTSIGAKIMEMLPQIKEKGIEIIGIISEGIGAAIPKLGDGIGTAILSIASFIKANLPSLIAGGIEIVKAIGQGIVNNLPILVNTGRNLATRLLQAIKANLPGMLASGLEMIKNIVAGIQKNLPLILAKGREILSTVVNGIKEKLSDVGASGSSIMSTIADKIIEYLPVILEKGGQILTSIINGIAVAIPQLGTVIGNIIDSISRWISANLPTIVQKGVLIVISLVTGLIKSVPSVIGAMGKLKNAIISTLQRLLPNVLKLAVSIVSSIARGLGGAAVSLVKGAMNRIKTAMTSPIESAKSKISGIVNKIKGFFPLHIGKIFSGLQLPHISVSGGSAPFGIGGKGSLPHFNVSWYAKGAVFDNPTVVGVGEAGREAVIPLEGRYMRPFARVIADEMGGSGQTIIINTTVNGAEDPEDWADRAVREIKLKVRTA